jgi:hypothetical protein
MTTNRQFYDEATSLRQMLEADLVAERIAIER